jgi:hypothetical protein
MINENQVNKIYIDFMQSNLVHICKNKPVYDSNSFHSYCYEELKQYNKDFIQKLCDFVEKK